MKQVLLNATVLATPNEGGRFVLDTEVSAVAIAGILHQEEEKFIKNHPSFYESCESLTRTQLTYGTPKLEMYAVFYFIEKFYSYIARREFTLDDILH